ncbi:MAG TPA: glycosyltransferase family 9 protein [Streptosporangiaceae bacterium]
MTERVLVVRPDGMGDVLLTGPAVRAVAASGAEVTFLAGAAGAGAAALLPGVAAVLTADLAWIAPSPGPFDPAGVRSLIDQVRAVGPSAALIFTSFHQSPLPTALVLRMAGVPRIAAISVDYPGSLLDVRHRLDDDVPEAERNLSLARAAGYALPAGDSGRLAVTAPRPDGAELIGGRYVVVHARASVPARAPSVGRVAAMVGALARAGHQVAVTGSAGQAPVVSAVCQQAGAPGVVDLGGRTSLPALAAVLAGAEVVVAPNTGAAHLAAAAGTPVVSLFAPVVPAARWAPYGVPHRVLGRQDAACTGTRARVCPVRGHPCLDTIEPADVVAAVEELAERAPAGVSP